MKKQVLYSFGVKGDNYTKIISEIEKSREKNKEIIENHYDLSLEPLGYHEVEDMGEEIAGWSSKGLPDVPKNKLGRVSGFCVIESTFLIEDKGTRVGEFFMGYFDDNPNFEGETDDMDGYHFIGFTNEEVVECAKEIAEYWKLTKT